MRWRLAGAAAASLTAALCGCGGSSPAAAPPVTTTVTVTTTPPAPTLEVLDCSGDKPKIRPVNMTIACGDGSSSLSGLTWTKWTTSGATASGTAVQDDCKPDCADGHELAYPATVTLFGTYPASGGVELFSGLTEDFGGTYESDFPNALADTVIELPSS